MQLSKEVKMLETQFKDILDREDPPQHVNQYLSESIELLKEVSNYGARLIIRMFSISDRKTKDVVILAILLKHAVAMIDALEILLSQGATIASQLPLRTMFETSLYIDWILKKDTEKRASQYYVWHLRKKKRTNLTIFKGTKENLDFIKTLINTPLEKVLPNLKIEQSEIKRQNDKIDKLLKSKKYQSINSEFNRLQKKKYDVAWYRPWGANSIGEMAGKLNRRAEYNIFYSHLSEITHSHSINQHISFQGDKLIFENVRNLQGIDTIIRYGVTIAFKIYRKILDSYSPAEQENFSRKYVEEWRKRFNSITRIEYKNEEFNVF